MKVSIFDIRSLEDTGFTKIKRERRASNVTFQYWLSKSFPKAPEPFGKPVAAVEFMTELPWILEVPCNALAESKIAKAEEVMNRYKNTLSDLTKPSNQT